MLLADEINRTPPRTQAALLEAMQEGHVTVDGKIHWLTPPFIVIATQNPFEHEGIFALPESQLDRFFVKVVLEYGSEEDELKMLAIPHRGISSDMLGDVRPLIAEGRFLVLQEAVDNTFVPDAVARFLINIVRKTRELPGVCSARARARRSTCSLPRRRRRVCPDGITWTVDDVAAMAPLVLRHRVIADAADPADVVRQAVEAALSAAVTPG